MKKQKGRAPSLVKAVAKGMGVSVIWTILVAMGIAKLIDMEVMPTEYVGYGSMAAYLTAVYLGGTMAYCGAGHKGNAAAGLTGLAYYLVLLLVNALFFGGHFTGLAVTLALVAMACIAVVLTKGKGRNRKSRSHYKIPRA